MKIYLVRHGESEGNTGPFVQGPKEPLTKNGVHQAELIANRFLSIPADIILSSPEIRAKQTAEIIGKKIKKPIELNDLLIEFVKPSLIIGKLKNDPDVKKIKKLLKDNFHILGWKHSNEENFEDFKKRSIQLLDNLSSRKEENIIIITHGILMRMIVATMIMGHELTSYEYWKFFITLVLDNTGITVLQSSDTDSYSDAAKWTLVSWNDSAHLGVVK